VLPALVGQGIFNNNVLIYHNYHFHNFIIGKSQFTILNFKIEKTATTQLLKPEKFDL